MPNIAEPIAHDLLMLLLVIAAGICLITLIAFLQRWQQIRYRHYVHGLRRKYRPHLAKVLAGTADDREFEVLRKLPLGDLEILADPLFSQRKLPDSQVAWLAQACAELGLIGVWEARMSKGRPLPAPSQAGDGAGLPIDHLVTRHLLRAKSMRNLGRLRYRASWPALVKALDEHEADIQLVALEALAAIAAPESFPVLRERLHAIIQKGLMCPWLPRLVETMSRFNVACAPALLPSLRHPNPRVRLYGMRILRTMVRRHASSRLGLKLTREVLTPQLADLLPTALATDFSAEIRAGAGELVALLADERATPTLRELLFDHHFLVRESTLSALARSPRATRSMLLEVRDCLRDPDWRVRESAIQTLLSLGREGRHQLYQYFLTSRDDAPCRQIVEVIERTGLISALVEEYSQGNIGIDALMLEYLAGDTAPLGLSGILRTLDPEVRRKFLDRFLPYMELKARFVKAAQEEVQPDFSLQQTLEFAPYVAA